MTRTLNFIKQKRMHFILCLVWIALWVVPWGKLPSIQGNIFLAFLTDMVRLGIALMIFIFPGALLYILLREKSKPGHDLPGILPIGFVLSVFLVAIIGLTGRVSGLSFAFVKYSFALVGLVELVFVMSFRSEFRLGKKDIQESFHSVLRNPPLILAFSFVILMSFHDNLFFIDDTTYLAYLTNWQHSEQLGFRNIVHEVDAIEHFRFWLALYPMGQALLADLSGLSGLLLLGNYLEPYLIVLAVITSYWFARILGLSRRAAGFAVLIQVTLYTWMMGDHFPVGMWFYQSMAEDKVTAAFILAPVFFVFSSAYIQKPIRENLILVFLAGIGLTLTHPVILFFAIFVVACMFGIAFILKKVRWREATQMAIIFISVMLPYLIIRVSDYDAQVKISYDAVSASESFQIERYTRVISDVFYGLNPDVLKFIDFEVENEKVYAVIQLFRLIPVTISLLAGVIAIKNLKKGLLYWYVTSCLFLIAFATIPYTGWILGYFVSARLISRTSWFSPLGIAGVLILQLVANRLRTSDRFVKITTPRFTKSLSWMTVGMLVCFIFASPLLVYHFLPRIPAYFELLDHNKQLAQVGTYIDQNTTSPVMVIGLDYWDTQLLPGVSAQSRLISFREEKEYNGFNSFLTIDEIRERIYASTVIRSLVQDVSEKRRCAYIERYKVKFVVAQPNTAENFERELSGCDFVIASAFQTKSLVLLEIR